MGLMIWGILADAHLATHALLRQGLVWSSPWQDFGCCDPCAPLVSTVAGRLVVWRHRKVLPGLSGPLLSWRLCAAPLTPAHGSGVALPWSSALLASQWMLRVSRHCSSACRACFRSPIAKAKRAELLAGSARLGHSITRFKIGGQSRG